MEMFSAADEEQWKIIARQIDETDYYVVIVAHRYGSITQEGISFTEKEYDYAVSKGVPVLGFVIDEKAAWPNEKHEQDSKSKKKLTEFKKKVRLKLIQTWSSRDDLHGKFSIALMKSITANPRTGWIRTDESSDPQLTRELARLSRENADLRSEIEALRKATIEQRDRLGETAKILANNSRTFRVRTEKEWTSAKSVERTLNDIFRYAAPYLLSEASALAISQFIALGATGKKFYDDWPVGKNTVSELIADLAALDLLQPSTKRHSVRDANEYWCLTQFGKQLQKELRRVNLQEGLTPTAPERSVAEQ